MSIHLLLYLAALRYYNKRAFTYLELGDGDELWENRSIERIRQMHPHSSDPTSAAKNNTGKGAVEQRLTQWAAKQQVIFVKREALGNTVCVDQY